MEDCIRNFVIIAHIDHGKSTLADRFLEATRTVEKRLMKPQYLDQLELERERGITIKMAPVRMKYVVGGSEYAMNLIDTPGHSDFGYEVSRALAAVEGAILLVDAMQGVQAQTLANLEAARRASLVILGAVNKIDVASSEQIAKAASEMSELLGVSEEDIFRVSGKTGEGVETLLAAVAAKVPPPARRDDPFITGESLRGLIFDSLYDDHKGVIAFVRLFAGSCKAGETYELLATGARFKTKEVGYFLPKLGAASALRRGEIGYIATGVKDTDILRIGDTVSAAGLSGAARRPLTGYAEPKPVVFVSFYPAEADKFEELKQALGRLRLTDASLVFEPETSEVLGRGFKGGFLGRLHFEITAERLSREFGLDTVHSFPSVEYRARTGAGEWRRITNPRDFPDDATEILEPVTHVEILVPPAFLGAVLELKELFRFSKIGMKHLRERTIISAELPLADLIRDLDDKLKSVSQGFASLHYELAGWERADVAKMSILVAGNVVPGLTRVLPRRDLEREARFTAEKLKELLPRQQFSQAIQAVTRGNVIARETIPALRKDVTGYLYGGDRTRKMKLWKKQQEGKKRLKEFATRAPVKIPAAIFKELLKKA